jgi:predicted transcriptional regulator
MEMYNIEKAKELNKVMSDCNLSIKERQDFVDTLSEEEMRGIFKDLMTVWETDKENVNED